MTAIRLAQVECDDLRRHMFPLGHTTATLHIAPILICTLNQTASIPEGATCCGRNQMQHLPENKSKDLHVLLLHF